MERIFVRKSFSDEFKRAAVQKSTIPGGPGIVETAGKIGVHQATIRRWIGLYAMSPTMSNSKLPPDKKYQILMETSALSKSELGEYLRKHGLHSHEINEWKEECLSGFKRVGRPRKDPELKSIEKEKKVLQRDLRRKDRALAEMAARIVLLKKSRLLWGDPEDDE